MRVFMIDDDLCVLKSIQRTLFTFDIEVDYSQYANEAISIVENGNYEYVLLDYYMPEYSGEWFMKHVLLPNHTKVILLTGYANSRVLARMKALGVSDCWIKPITGAQIVDGLHALDQRSQLTSVESETDYRHEGIRR